MGLKRMRVSIRPLAVERVGPTKVVTVHVTVVGGREAAAMSKAQGVLETPVGATHATHQVALGPVSGTVRRALRPPGTNGCDLEIINRLTGLELAGSCSQLSVVVEK